MEDRKHLTRERLAALWQAGGGHLTAGAGAHPAEIDHVASCEICRRELELLEAAAQDLMPLPAVHNSEAAQGCPPEIRLRDLAAGVLAGVEADALLEHAGTCDHCGSVLRDAANAFQEETSPDEAQAIGALRSSQPDGQKRLAAQLSATPRVTSEKERAMPADTGPARTRNAWTGWGWALAAAAAVVVIVGASIAWRTSHPDVNRLLAQAYTERRPMELRIAGAEYAPVRVERGPAGSTMDRPVPLSEAESLISKKLAASPNDPFWLAARGRAELLNWNYEAAIKSLEQARDYGNASPDLLVDLASAYFQRAEAGPNNESDYGQAVEFLGQALRQQPENSVALYNSAIAKEKMFLYSDAVQDCEKYLAIDNSSAWAGDIRKRMSALREKLSKKPQALLAPSDASLAKDVQRRLEDYVLAATRKWIPETYDAHAEPGSREVNLRAAAVVAQAAEQRAQDRWLRDFLRELNFSTAPEVVALAESLEQADRGDYAGGLEKARAAAAFFRHSENHAGMYRAQVEEVYNLHLSSQAAQCVEKANQVLRAVAALSYRWIEIQLENEKGICQNMLGLAREARESFTRAYALNARRAYPVMALRTLLLLASSEASIGEPRLAWQSIHRGIAEYWNGDFPVMRGYSFYASWETTAQNARQWFLTLSISREMVRLLANDSDLLLRGVANGNLAQAAFHAGMTPLSEQHFQEAKRLFAASAPNEVTRTRLAEVELWLARISCQKGQRKDALASLVEISTHFDKLENRFVTADYFQTLADLEAKAGSKEKAREAFARVIALSEKGLSSLGAMEAERISWTRIADDAYRGLTQLELDAGEGAQALELWEWYRSAPFRNSKPVSGAMQGPADAPIPESSLVTKHLSRMQNETGITYAVLPQGLAIWIFDSRGVVYHWKPMDTEQVKSKARRFLQFCANPNSNLNELKALGRSLYDQLVLPAISQLPQGRTLLVEADGALAEIPFAALVNPAGKYLIEDFAIVYSLGVGSWDSLRPVKPVGKDSRALIVAVPSAGDASAGLPPLPDVAEEAAAVASHFPNHRLLTGPQASLGNIQRELPQSVVFHFAGHAKATRDEVGLVLWQPPGRGEKPLMFTAKEIRPELFRNVQLVVLSACSTERGKAGGFADSESLVRALLRAGVPQVVASRWNVDSTSTTRLLKNVYDDLNLNSSVNARLASRKDHTTTDHPYLWASFAVSGIS